MNVSCSNCGTTYRIDESKIPPQGVKAKCPKCANSFVLKPPGAEDAAAAADPFGGAPPDPFGGGGGDPFGGGGGGGGGASADPFGGGGGAASAGGDPFGGAPQDDPFGGATSGGAPNGGAAGGPPPPPGDDPFGSEDPFGGGGGGGVGDLFGGGDKTEFRIQRASGETIGPFDLFTLKQMIYEQQLDGSEQIEDSQGEFVPIMNNEELAEIFRLLGKQAPAAGGGAPAGGPPGDSPPAGNPAMGSPAAGGDPGMGADPFGGSTSAGEPAPVPEPAPSFDLDSADAGAKDKVLIGVERVWSGLKRPGTLIAILVILLVGVVGTAGWTQRATISELLGLSQARAAKQARLRAEPNVFADVRSKLDAAVADYELALQQVPDDAITKARLAEVHAILWSREPQRLGAQEKAKARLAEAKGDSAEVQAARLRAQARLALGAGNPDEAGKHVEQLASVAPEDPMVPFLRGEVALVNGDGQAAEAAFAKASSATLDVGTENPVPVGQATAAYGQARAKALQDDWEAAKKLANQAVALEPSHAGAKALVAFAVSRLDAGNTDKARTELLQVAEDSSVFTQDRARVHYYLGVFAEDAGQLEPALYRYRRAVSLDPRDVEARAAARRLFRQRFPKRDADKWLESVAVMRGSKAMDLVVQGRQAFADKGSGAALLKLEKARKQDGNSAAVHLALGDVHVENAASLDKAAMHYDRAIELDPTWADALVGRARVHLKKGENEKAASLAAKAVEIDPTNVEGRMLAGEASLASGKAKEAIGYFRITLQFDPYLSEGWVGLGKAAIAVDRAAEAVEPLQKAVELAPKASEPLMALGQAYEALGELEKAAQTYNQALALDAENLELQKRVGVLLVKAGKYVEAKKQLHKVVETSADDAEVHFYLGQANELTSDYTTAEDEYKKVAALEPKNHLAYYHLGVIYFVQGQYGDAKDYFSRALEVDPSYYLANEKLADLYIENLEYDKALAELRKVEKRARKLPGAERREVLKRVYLVQANVWRTRTDKRDNRKARSYYSRVIKLDRRNADAYYGLGMLNIETNPQAAMQDFNRAIRFDPDFAPPYRDLGYLHKQVNNCKAALRSFRLYVRHAPEARDKRSIEDEISYLVPECG